MATNFINNLSNTYRGSPSLQKQFATEQDYLDLFDNNQVTPAMAQAYISVDDTSGIKSIINTKPVIINNDDGDGGPTGPTGGDYGYTGPGSTGSVSGFNIDDIGEGTIDDEDMPGVTGKGFMDMVGFISSPFGFIGKKAYNFAKQKYDNKKRRDKAAQDLADQAALDVQLAAAQKEITAKGYKDYGQGAADGSGGYNDGDGGSYSGKGEASDWGGGEKDGGYIDGSNRRKKIIRSYFKGGVVSLKNGGSTNGSGKAALSAKVKELMDDGYEFGEAVKEAMKQGYMNGGRIKSYFKGGLVSLRGR